MVKHLFAYDNQNNIVSIGEAIKGNSYYLLPDQQVSLVVKAENSIYKVKHFSMVPDSVVDINGKSISVNRINESPEHYNMKMKIAKELKFQYKSHTILLKSARVEYRINETMYRADVMAELHCGTPCIIEIIKSADVSDVKSKYIKENQILTFKLYLNKYGNIDTSNIEIVGCMEIDEIRRRIDVTRESIRQQKERKFEFNEEIFRFRRKFDNIKTPGDTQYRENVRVIEEIRGLKESIKNVKTDVFSEFCGPLQSKIKEVINSIRESEKRIESTTKQIENCKPIYRANKERIDTTRNEINGIEKQFSEVAQSCRIEWFRPSWIKYKPNDLIKEIKYWTT